MGKFDDALLIIGRLLPVVYIAFNLGNLLVLVASAILLIISLATWSRGSMIGLALLNLTVTGLMTPVMGLVFSVVSTLILDSALRVEGNSRPWWVYALAVSLSALTSTALIGPIHALPYIPTLTYLTIVPLISWLTLNATRISLKPSRRLETVAGIPITYRLTIVTRPRIKAFMEINGGELAIEPSRLVINGEGTVNVKARYQVGGVKEPRLRLRLRDLRGLVTVERTIRHPPITVTPRLGAAIEFAMTILMRKVSVWGVEDVEEVREYVPGDPVKRIHWKKTLKLNKLVVKALRQVGEETNIVLVPYASNEATLDKIGEAVALTTALILMNSNSVNIYVLNEGIRRFTITPRNFNEIMAELTKLMKNLNIRLVGGLDTWGLLSELRRGELMMINNIREPLIIIGERTWTRGLCRGNRTCILITPHLPTSQ